MSTYKPGLAENVVWPSVANMVIRSTRRLSWTDSQGTSQLRIYAHLHYTIYIPLCFSFLNPKDQSTRTNLLAGFDDYIWRTGGLPHNLEAERVGPVVKLLFMGEPIMVCKGYNSYIDPFTSVSRVRRLTSIDTNIGFLFTAADICYTGQPLHNS